MEFGRIDPNQLPFIDFSLPADSPITTAILRAADRVNDLPVHIGCAKWGRREWKGLLYPPKTREADYLSEYAKHFNSIELNATFYKIYKPEAIANWREQVAGNPGFKFCPKFAQRISHIRRLKNAEELTTQYYEGIMAFGRHLGPLFLQLANNYLPKNFPDLKLYLEQLPKDVPVFVEVRHKDWFGIKENYDKLFGLLQDLKLGAVITDSVGRPDVLHMALPTPHAFIRFVGNGLHQTDYLRIDSWVDRIRTWQEQGLQSLWFFVHQHDERHTPVLADYLAGELNRALGLNLRRPGFVIGIQGDE